MKRTITNIVLLASVYVCGGQTTGSVETKKSMGIDECVALAMKQSYEMRSADKAVESARLKQGTAWDMDKTEVSLSQDPTSGGSPDNALSVSQSIDFPTLYVSRRRHLKAETQAEQARREVARKKVETDVRRAYCRVLYQEECLRILAAQDSLLQRYRMLAEKRYQAGEVRQLEVLAAERLLGECRAEKASRESETEQAELTLGRLIGSDFPVVPTEKTQTALPFVLPSYNYAATAEGQYAGRQVDVAAKAVSVAKNGFAPSLSLSLRNQMVISGWNPYNQDRSRFSGGNFMGFEVGVGVPLFYGATRAKVKAARKEQEMAQLALEAQRQRGQIDYSAALSRINSARVRLEYYQGTGMRTAEQQVELASREYEAGEIGYVEYVSVLQQSLDERLKAAEAIAEYNDAVLELQRICN